MAPRTLNARKTSAVTYREWLELKLYQGLVDDGVINSKVAFEYEERYGQAALTHAITTARLDAGLEL